MSAPTFGTIGALFGSTTSAPAFAVPASVAAGDIIVVMAYLDSTATVSAMPTDFVHANGSPVHVAPAAGFGEHNLLVAWKRATAGDTGTYTFTLSASVFVYGNAERISGCVASGDPWDATATAQGGAVNISTAPALSLVTLGADRILVYGATNHNGDGGTWSPPAGFSQRQGGTNQATHEISDLVQTAAGSTGSLSATTTASGFMGAFLGALIGTTGGAVDASPARPVPPLPLLEQFVIARAQAFQDSRAGATVTGTAVAALGGTAATVIGTPTVLGVTPAPLGALAATALGTPSTPDHSEGRPTPPLPLLQQFAAARARAFQPSRTAITETGLAVAALGGTAATMIGTPTVLGVTPAALGGVAATAIGAVSHTGLAVAPLGRLTGTAVVGAAAVTGTAVAALGGLAGTVLGVPTAPGLAPAPLGTLTATAIGRRTTAGTAAAPLGRVAATVLGTRTHRGTAAAALGGLAAVVSGATAGTTLAGNAHGPLPLAPGAITVHTGTIAGAVT